MVRVVSVIGLKKTGKSTVVEKLVSALVIRGHSVGTVKSMALMDTTRDIEGKDTWRHQEAGASFVIAQTGVETVFFQRHQEKGKKPLAELMRLVPEGTEFLVCEGLGERFPSVVEIVCLKKEEAWEETLKERKPSNIIALSGILGNEKEEFKDYPFFNVLDDGDLDTLVELVLGQAVEFE